MSSLPPAIFFINGDIDYPQTNPVVFPGTDPKISELTTLQTQLFIDDTMTKTEFDARVVADPNYPTIIHLQGLRILVIVPSYNDGYVYDPDSDSDWDNPHINISNVDLADVVLFLHQGLADVEKNNFGPPGQSYEIQRINAYELLRVVNSPYVVTVPNCGTSNCDKCSYPFFCDGCHTFSGIRICASCGCSCACGCTTGLVDSQGVKVGIVYAPNCDNIFHNSNFINRK